MIVFILILAFLLRLISLNQSLWLDEAVQAITAQESFAYIFQEIRGDFHPPLYHFLMHFWGRIFGASEIALRMPSVLFGVGTVWAVYRIINELNNGLTNSKKKNLGLVAAIFMATAPFHIYYSQEARMYSLVTFLATGSMYFFLKINKLSINGLTNFKNYFYYFIFTLLAIYTDYFAFLVLTAQIIILLWRKKYKFIIHSSLFIILLYLPWLSMFITQLKAGSVATRALPEWGKLVNLSFVKALPLTLVKFSLGRITIFNQTLYSLVAGGLALVYGFLGFRGRKEMTIVAWLGVPLLLAWLASLIVPNYQPFRLLLVLPAFYLILTLGIFSLKSQKLKLMAIAFVLGVNLLSLSRYYLNPYFYREDWRGAVSWLKTQTKSAVILPSETSSWPIKYYDPEEKIKLFYGNRGINQIKKLSINGLTDYEKIFYIRYLVPLFDPQELVLEELRQKGYTRVEEKSFNQILVWEFEKK